MITYNHFPIILIVLCIVFFSSLLAISYSYDSLNRLESVFFDNGYSIQYNYDNNGNLTSCVQTIPNSPPLSPQFVTINYSANQIELTWDSVNENINGTPIIIDFYSIEYSESPNGPFNILGTSTEIFYIDLNPTGSQRFYRIKAVINENRSFQPVLHKKVIRNSKKR